MARFTLPRDLYHGKGSLEELKNLVGKKAIIVVGGGSMRRKKQAWKLLFLKMLSPIRAWKLL